MSFYPLVSIIIPIYNAEDFISDCIESVINQSYRNIEIIIVNDGSIDGTDAIVKSYQERYGEIKYFSQPNMGCSWAKNTGLKFAKGEYIQYLDADDLLSEKKIEVQVEALRDFTDGLAVCKTIIFETTENKDTGNELDSEFLFSTEDTVGFLLNLYGINGKNGMIQPNSFLLPRNIVESIEEWNTSLSPSPDEDGEYFCRAILTAKRILFTSGINYYRKLPNVSSLSKKKSLEFAKGAIKSVLLKKDHVLELVDSYAVRELFVYHLAQCAYLYSKDYPELIPFLKKEMKTLGLKKIPVHKFTGNFGLVAKFIGFWNGLFIKNVIM